MRGANYRGIPIPSFPVPTPGLENPLPTIWEPMSIRDLIQRVARFRPFLVLGISSAVLVLGARALSSDYDDGGIGSAVFAIGQIVGIPYNAVYAIITIGESNPPRYYDVLSLVIGLALFVLADVLLTRATSR